MKPIYTEAEMQKICKQYDFSAMLRAFCNPGAGGSFEAEISQDYNMRSGRSPKGEMTIPDFVLCRALTGKTNVAGQITGNGSALVGNDVIWEGYTQALAARTVLGKAGITVVSGLVGDAAIPKDSAVQASWMQYENSDAPQVEPTFSHISATPHTCAAHCEFTRRLSLQSGVPFSGLIAEIITNAIARGIEKAAFDGTGANGQPTGLSNTTGIQTVSLSATPTKAQLVSMWQKVFEQNVHGVRCAYIGGAGMKGTLCQTLDIHTITSGTGEAVTTVGGVSSGKYLCDNGKVEGYDYLTTNLVANKTLWFGDWENLMLCTWSGVDLLIDKYTLSTSGAIRITALQDVDIVARHPEAFVKAVAS